MRLCKFAAGIILFCLDFLVVLSFPFRYVGSILDKVYYLLFFLGCVIYLLVHVVRKPENFYVWNHEFSHLLASKMFFKDVKGFHITRRRGGKVVVEKTNFLIDLSPYLFYPLIIFFVFLAILFRKAGFQAGIRAYFLAAGYLLTMMLAFTVTSFVSGQEDIKRNGYLFSATLVLLLNFIILPVYFLPGVIEKKEFIVELIDLWFNSAKLNTYIIYTIAGNIYADMMGILSR